MAECLERQIDLIRSWAETKALFPTISAFESEVIGKLNSLFPGPPQVYHNGFTHRRCSVICQGCKQQYSALLLFDFEPATELTPARNFRFLRPAYGLAAHAKVELHIL